jgi:hypothetical protein
MPSKSAYRVRDELSAKPAPTCVIESAVIVQPDGSRWLFVPIHPADS